MHECRLAPIRKAKSLTLPEFVPRSREVSEDGRNRPCLTSGRENLAGGTALTVLRKRHPWRSGAASVSHRLTCYSHANPYLERNWQTNTTLSTATGALVGPYSRSRLSN